MKTTPFCLSLASMVGLFAGCAMASPALVLDPVGPEARVHASVSPQGTLVVFSDIDPHPNNALEDYNSHYTDYEIWTSDGSKKLRFVVNHRFPVADEPPTRVELAPGQYLIKATATTYRTVKIPVLIVANRVTSLHLEGGLGADKTRSDPGKVYLPNGEIVGQRAAMQGATTASINPAQQR